MLSDDGRTKAKQRKCRIFSLLVVKAVGEVNIVIEQGGLGGG